MTDIEEVSKKLVFTSNSNPPQVVEIDLDEIDNIETLWEWLRENFITGGTYTYKK